jgi:hypothetical protein
LDVYIGLFKLLRFEGLPLHVAHGVLVQAHPSLKSVFLRHDDGLFICVMYSVDIDGRCCEPLYFSEEPVSGDDAHKVDAAITTLLMSLCPQMEPASQASVSPLAEQPRPKQHLEKLDKLFVIG